MISFSTFVKEIILSNMDFSSPDINSLSPHLFWDVDIREISWDEHKIFILQRVLEYGVLSDWTNLNSHVGIAELGKIATQIRSLDKKSLAFISTLSNIPITDFLCYTTQQSTPQHWYF
jgi:hypothetical protein